MLAAPLGLGQPPGSGGRRRLRRRARQRLTCSLGWMLLDAGSTHCPAGGPAHCQRPTQHRVGAPHAPSCVQRLPRAAGRCAWMLRGKRWQGWEGSVGGCRHAAAMRLPCRPSPSMPPGLPCISASLQRSQRRLAGHGILQTCACEVLHLLARARQPSRPCCRPAS